MRTENLAVMLTDMKGFTAATSRQSRAENARLLALQDELVLPVLRAFGGRRLKTIGDAYLVLFRSPTSALLCGAAIQDRLWDYARRVPPEERIEVRVILTLGEVRLVGSGAVPRDVFGEAVNLATRVEGEAEAGEIWFSEAVRLVADPTQVEADDLGERRLRGIDEQVRLFRLRRVAGPGEHAPPYGNAALGRVLGLAPPDPATLARAIQRRASIVFGAARAAAELAAVIPLRWAFAVSIACLMALGGWRFVATAVERQIASGDLSGALAAIEQRAAKKGAEDPKVLYLRGRLAEARAAAGKGSLRDATRWWVRAVAAGSGEALSTLRDDAESWECDRRRMAARALAEIDAPEALPTLRALARREPPDDAAREARRFAGVEGVCGAGDLAREGIRALQSRKKSPASARSLRERAAKRARGKSRPAER